MGRTKGPYNAEFPIGSNVKIVGIENLKRFASEWQYHHPLEQEQIAFGGAEGEVATVSFYHSGDELYELVGIPGIWHEQCIKERT